jgi:hypothetical protein
MEAVAVSDSDDAHCNCALGFAWDGNACVFLADCACQGNDCDKLTATIEECQSQHQSCI